MHTCSVTPTLTLTKSWRLTGPVIIAPLGSVLLLTAVAAWVWKNVAAVSVYGWLHTVTDGSLPPFLPPSGREGAACCR